MNAKIHFSTCITSMNSATLSRITLYDITHKYVSASSLISSLFPSSPSSLKAMISSQSFSFVTISSIRSAPQLSRLAPVGQFSLPEPYFKGFSYQLARNLLYRDMLQTCYLLSTYMLPTCYIQTFYNKKRFEVLVARLD